VTTKIGASIGSPPFHPLAMSNVRRPLIIAPQSVIHSRTTTTLASGA
jgi:hypothetical protein